MKNTLLVLVLLFGVSVNAQVTFKPGVRTGVNLANITNSGGDTKIDFYIGALASIKFAHFYTLQPEINYSRQGAKSQNYGTGLELQYLSFGVVNKFYPFSDIELHIIAGPAFSFKTGDNVEYEFIEDFDIVFFGGLGYDFGFGMSVEARYNVGLVDIFGKTYDEVDYFDELFLNKFIQIGFSYNFNLKK